MFMVNKDYHTDRQTNIRTPAKSLPRRFAGGKSIRTFSGKGLSPHY